MCLSIHVYTGLSIGIVLPVYSCVQTLPPPYYCIPNTKGMSHLKIIELLLDLQQIISLSNIVHSLLKYTRLSDIYVTVTTIMCGSSGARVVFVTSHLFSLNFV
jgi:hypothetical protein